MSLLFFAENIGIMRKMRISVNYADPHRRILSDAMFIKPQIWSFQAVVLPAMAKKWTKKRKKTSKACKPLLSFTKARFTPYHAKCTKI